MLKISFKKNDYMRKNGTFIPCVDVKIVNEDNGLELSFTDFTLTLPVNEFTLTKNIDELKHDDYGRYIFDSYILNNKYTFAFNILIGK